MRVPIRCMDARLRQVVRAFRPGFSLPQYSSFVIGLLALLRCQEPRTLTALLRTVAVRATLAGLSRCLAKAPWDEADVAQSWRERCDAQVGPRVADAHARQRAARPTRVGRPKAPAVTGPNGRHWVNQANVRSITQRRGSTTQPF